MKTFLLILLAAAPVSARWGADEGRAAGGLVSGRAEVSIISGVPLLDLLAARDKAAFPFAMGGKNFLASVVFDANWDSWVTIKPAGGGFGAGAWKETDLASGAVYKYDGLELNLRETDGAVSVEARGGEKAQIVVNDLFDRLYKDSMQVTFGGIVTYAVFRNLEPLTETEGTVTLRTGSDGLYYFSVTPDAQIEPAIRWLLAVNGVLYGLRIEEGSLLFVSKQIEMGKPVFAAERSRAR